MSFIVFSPKEKKIIADTYVFESTDLPGGIKRVSHRTEQKIKITEDNYFAYCFHCLQQEEYLPLIFNYITRFETGMLTEKDKIEFPEKFTARLGVATKRHFYYINPCIKNSIQIRDFIWDNESGIPCVYLALELNAEDIWNAIHKERIFAISGEKQIVSTTKLSLIEKQTKKKKEDDNAAL